MALTVDVRLAKAVSQQRARVTLPPHRVGLARALPPELPAPRRCVPCPLRVAVTGVGAAVVP
jgi:hypothetical protein